MKPKLLWVGDVVVQSGFSACTHAALDVLHKQWDVIVVGINYDGSPHNLPYKVYPSARAYTGEDVFGVKRFGQFVSSWRPDAAVLVNDVWNVPAYLDLAADVPVVGWLAIDGKNSRGAGLNGLAGSVFWTQFAAAAAHNGGYTGPSAVIPLGVDTDKFVPRDKAEARGPRCVGLPENLQNGFVVGMVGRNQERKHLDLALIYFREWIRKRGADDAYLFLHVAPTGDESYDIKQLVEYLGLEGRVVLFKPGEIGYGLRRDDMSYLYSCFDVFLSTSSHEGWNLCALEAMACGVPCILPNQGGPGEWAKDVAIMVGCHVPSVTPQRINAIGGIPDMADTVMALDQMYTNKLARASYAEAGYALAHRPEYQWSNIAQSFADVLRGWVWPAGVPEPEQQAVGG